MRTTRFSSEFYQQIDARPTTYNGVRYKSGLEALWASFFDECGWRHGYEPPVPGRRVPDFVLRGLNKDVYVEVKPTEEIDNEVFEIAREWKCGSDIMLLGNCPNFTRNIVRLGWMSESEKIEGDVAYALPDEVFVSEAHYGGLDFFHSTGRRNNRMHGSSQIIVANRISVESLWVLAGKNIHGEEI